MVVPCTRSVALAFSFAFLSEFDLIAIALIVVFLRRLVMSRRIRKKPRRGDSIPVDCHWCRLLENRPWVIDHVLEEFDMYIENRPKGLKSESSTNPVEDKEFAGDYPALYEYLAAVLFDDGTPRETSTLTVFVEHGRFKAAVNDRQNEGVLFCTANTYGELLEVIEECLKSGEGDWRDKSGKRRKG